MEFGVDPNRQDAICEEPAEIDTELLDYDPDEVLHDSSGFRRSTTCYGIQLVGGQCDFIHICGSPEATVRERKSYPCSRSEVLPMLPRCGDARIIFGGGRGIAAEVCGQAAL